MDQRDEGKAEGVMGESFTGDTIRVIGGVVFGNSGRGKSGIRGGARGLIRGEEIRK